MKLTALIGSIFLTVICFGAVAEDDPTVATVNGKALKQSTLQFYALERRQMDPNSQAPAKNLIDDIVNMQLLKEEAHKKKLDKTSAFKERMNFIQLTILSQVAMIDYLDNNPISEERLKEEYDSRIGEMKITEIKASHILLKDKKAADDVIKKLDKGDDFAGLAKEYSTGPSGPKGGELGWFRAQQMVPEFSEALLKLKNGAYTKQPVQTQFGWHIILRSGERDGIPPSFEAIKSKIAATLEQEHIQKHINKLRESANIKIMKQSAE